MKKQEHQLLNNQETCGSETCGCSGFSDEQSEVQMVLPQNAVLKKTSFRIGGLDCGDCAEQLRKRIASLDGVKTATVNFGAGKLIVEYTLDQNVIIQAISAAGYQIIDDTSANTSPIGAKAFLDTRIITTAIAGLLLAGAMVLEWTQTKSTVTLALYVASIMIGGYHVAKSGWNSLRSFSPDMNALMSIAVIGAAVIGQWDEGATVVFLFSLGNALQAYTMDKTRQAIGSLMAITPREALIRRDGQEQVLAVQEIRVGDIMVIKPGERIAMDGQVTEGHSTVNQAAITGEAMPVEKIPGDVVYAGTINEQGALEIVVTKLVGDSTLAKILHLVEEAQAQKAPSQQVVDVFAKYYTPVILAGAAAVVIIPWLFLGQPFSVWFYRALILLVISCPCALVISTPVSIVAAIGSASKQGVLIKGGAHLEAIGKVRAIAFDKTGTLTYGQPKVTDIIPLGGYDEQALLGVAAALENLSEHPVARAVLERAQGISVRPVANFKAYPGRGAQGEIDGQLCYIGNKRLFTELGFNLSILDAQIAKLETAGKTTIVVGDKITVYGIIAVADVIRRESAAALDYLRNQGIEELVMLTGDSVSVASSVAKKLNIGTVYSELLPEDKVTVVKQLGEQYGSIAMVGDGINDAPALAAAPIGIVMGVAGSDAALETADIALMADDLQKLAYTIHLSRATVAVIKQNIIFSVAVKFIFVVLTVLGMANLWMAVFADTGAALLVTLNGMRLARK
mgnify:CR=1 FL=1